MLQRNDHRDQNSGFAKDGHGTFVTTVRIKVRQLRNNEDQLRNNSESARRLGGDGGMRFYTSITLIDIGDVGGAHSLK